MRPPKSRKVTAKEQQRWAQRRNSNVLLAAKKGGRGWNPGCEGEAALKRADVLKSCANARAVPEFGPSQRLCRGVGSRGKHALCCRVPRRASRHLGKAQLSSLNAFMMRRILSTSCSVSLRFKSSAFSAFVEDEAGAATDWAAPEPEGLAVGTGSDGCCGFRCRPATVLQGPAAVQRCGSGLSLGLGLTATCQ